MGKKKDAATNAAEEPVKEPAKETAEDVAERLKTEQARLFAPLILEVYQNRKDTLPPEVIEDIEKHLIGYWDRKTTTIKYRDRFKEKAQDQPKAGTAPITTPSTGTPTAQ
jgi:hypothetical protein